MIIDLKHNKILEEVLSEGFARGVEESLLPLLSAKYGKRLRGIQMYEDYIADRFFYNGEWYYPLTVILTDSEPITQWIVWDYPGEGCFEELIPYAYIGDELLTFRLSDTTPREFEEKLLNRAKYFDGNAIPVSVRTTTGDTRVLCGRFSQTFLDELARQITFEIEATHHVTGLASSGIRLEMVFAPGTHMEHTSGNVTYRRLLMSEGGRALKDFWVRWQSISGDGAYTVSDAVNSEMVRFAIGEDVPQKVREKEYRYLVRQNAEKYRSAMGRKNVVDWRELLKKAIKKGTLSRVIAPLADLASTVRPVPKTTPAPSVKPDPAPKSIEAVSAADEEDELMMAKLRELAGENAPKSGRMLTERDDEEMREALSQARALLGITEEEEAEEEAAAHMESAPQQAFQAVKVSKTEKASQEQDEESLRRKIRAQVEREFEARERERLEIEARRAVMEKEKREEEIRRLREERERAEEARRELEALRDETRRLEEEIRRGTASARLLKEEYDAELEEQESENETDTSAAVTEPVEEETEEPTVIIEPASEEALADEGFESDEDETEEVTPIDIEERLRAERLYNEETARAEARRVFREEMDRLEEERRRAEEEKLAEEERRREELARAEEQRRYLEIAQKLEAERLRQEEEERRRAEEEKLAEEMRRLEDIRRQEDERRAEALRLAEEHRKVEERARLENERHKAELARLEEERRRAEDAARLVYQQHLAEAERLEAERRRAEQLKAEQDLRIAEATRLAEEQRRLAEAARAEQQRKNEETARAEWEQRQRLEYVRREEERRREEAMRVEEERRKAEQARLAEEERMRLDAIRREEEVRRSEEALRLAEERQKSFAEGAPAAPAEPVPEKKYTYVSKTARLIFNRSVDPNIMGRIQQLMSDTIAYFNKQDVYISVRAEIANSSTIDLHFLKIPKEEEPLLINIVKVLGSSDLGIVKASIN